MNCLLISITPVALIKLPSPYSVYKFRNHSSFDEKVKLSNFLVYTSFLNLEIMYTYCMCAYTPYTYVFYHFIWSKVVFDWIKRKYKAFILSSILQVRILFQFMNCSGHKKNLKCAINDPTLTNSTAVVYCRWKWKIEKKLRFNG